MTDFKRPGLLRSFFTDHKHPVPPAAFHPERPLWLRRGLWWLRNPAADFMSFWLGIKGRPFKTRGRVSVKVPTREGSRRVFVDKFPTFNPAGGLQWLVHRLGRWEFPFVSYKVVKPKLEAYVGWRPSGAWGGPVLRPIWWWAVPIGLGLLVWLF